MVYGYIRVSTDRQTVKNQKYAIQSKYKVGKWINETISSRIPLNKRLLSKLLNDANKGDIIVVSELSRLGRSVGEIIQIMDICKNKEVIMYAIKENFELSDNINSKVIYCIITLLAEIERDLISQRTKEALLRLKSQGVKLGRPKGAKSKCKLNKHKKEIIKMYNNGVSAWAIADHFKVSQMTVYSFLRSL